MEHLHVWFVTAAYGITAVILLADALLPRFKFKSLLRGIQLRSRRSGGGRPAATPADPPAEPAPSTDSVERPAP